MHWITGGSGSGSQALIAELKVSKVAKSNDLNIKNLIGYMVCKYCNGDHSTGQHYAVKGKIKAGSYPQSSTGYKSAHEAADKAEKAKFPKGYKQMQTVDRKLPKGELAGRNTKSGKVEVSEKVPSKLRPEVAYHEATESKKLHKKRR